VGRGLVPIPHQEEVWDLEAQAALADDDVSTVPHPGMLDWPRDQISHESLARLQRHNKVTVGGMEAKGTGTKAYKEPLRSQSAKRESHRKLHDTTSADEEIYDDEAVKLSRPSTARTKQSRRPQSAFTRKSSRSKGTVKTLSNSSGGSVPIVTREISIQRSSYVSVYGNSGTASYVFEKGVRKAIGAANAALKAEARVKGWDTGSGSSRPTTAAASRRRSSLDDSIRSEISRMSFHRDTVMGTVPKRPQTANAAAVSSRSADKTPRPTRPMTARLSRGGPDRTDTVHRGRNFSAGGRRPVFSESQGERHSSVPLSVEAAKYLVAAPGSVVMKRARSRAESASQARKPYMPSSIPDSCSRVLDRPASAQIYS